MTSIHLDMNQIIQQELRERRAKMFFNNSPDQKITKISVNEGALLNAEYGPQQVESLLRYVIDAPLSKAMADAADDTNAVSHLNALKGRVSKNIHGY